MSIGNVLSGNVFTPRSQTASETAATASSDSDRYFEAAIAPLVPPLLRYFSRRVAVTDDAADCTSETLLALWRHRTRLPIPDDERRAWAYGFARKVLANHNRGRARRARVDVELRAAAAVPTAPMPEHAQIAVEALELLPKQDQELILLVIWEELSVAAAGRVLGIKPGAARARYSRTLVRLREAYAKLDV